MNANYESWRRATRRRNLAVLATVAVLFSPAIYGGIYLLPRLFYVNAWSECTTNLQVIAGAMHAYSQDWDGRLPPADRWCDALHPKYIQSQGHLTCPATHRPYSYAMNSKLNCAELASIGHPSKRPLIFESTKTHRNATDPLTSRRRDGLHRFDHGGRFVKGGLILFADLRKHEVPDDEELSP